MRPDLILSLGGLCALAAACGGDDGPALDGGALDGGALDGGALDAGPRPDAGPPDAGPPLDDSPWKGPWVIRPDVDRVTVRWETRLAPEHATVEYGPEAGGGMTLQAEGTTTAAEVRLDYHAIIAPEPDRPGTYYLNEVEVTGLMPATCYRYALVGFPERAGRFCTMHLTSDHTTPIRFYVIGDTNPVLLHTGELLSHTDPAESEWIIHAGDLQYYSSLVETWQSWFGMMTPLLEAGAFMPCVGNHESELDYEFEDYYVRLFGSAGQDGNEIRYHFQSGGVHFFSLSTEAELTAGSEQYEWFVARLDEVEAEPDYRFSVVYMHRPYYTVADYRPNLATRMALEPVITSHHVPLVIAGHIHGYERFEVGDVTYITSGGGGGILSNLDELVGDYPEDAALRVASGAFFEVMVISIDGMVLRGETYDDAGMLRDRFEKTVP